MTRQRLVLIAVLFTALLGATQSPTADTFLIARGSAWRYLDTGTAAPTGWRTVSFNDASWKLGVAELGYGDNDEATIVSFGPSSSAKYITTYFRQSFQVAAPGDIQNLTLRLKRDDGAIAYLNGTEVFRTNMPTGSVTHTTLAPSAIDDETFHVAAVNPSLLVSGANVLAVEIHQANGTSSDISFDAELVGSSEVLVTRGPYLQMGTSSSVVVRWRTSAATDSRVLYGTNPASLTSVASRPTQTTEHEVTLTGLLPQTRYYYSVGSSTDVLAGGDVDHAFDTAPVSGTSAPTRVWVLGDSGTADANARAVRDAYYAVAGSTRPHLWLMLGDNAYETGTDSEYQRAVFDMYPQTLRQSVLWPTLGNHDGATANSATQSGPYYDMFTLPKNAEAGGVASGTEAYYSFTYGDIHFICLESFETNRAAGSPMLTWLQADLAATNARWIVAFFHHPPYTKGSHNSDSELELREMRENALPILEAGGVDVVLTGHSHSYERSYLIDGHYGTSTTFTPSMKKDGGSGREEETGAYEKPASFSSHAGAVYAVAGSSGKISGGTLNHPAMFVSLNVLGSMILDIDGERLDARFIDNQRVVRDWFTLVKGGTTAPPPVIETSSVPNATVGVPYSTTLVASGGTTPYNWSLASGSLPAGLSLSTAGVISGTPSGSAAAYPFTARVTGSNGQSSTRAFSLTLVAAPPVPGAFAKSAPKNNAKNLAASLQLSWSASANAASYEYCIDTTADNSCAGEAWASTGTARVVTVNGLASRTTYSWQVRARNAQGTTLANTGTWWRFTTAR